MSTSQADIPARKGRDRGDSGNSLKKKRFFVSCNNPNKEPKGLPPSLFSARMLCLLTVPHALYFRFSLTLSPLSDMDLFRTFIFCFVLANVGRTAAMDDEWKSATATYTREPNGSITTEGACGYGDLHRAAYGRYSTALSTGLFNRGSTCGACFEVRCVDHILWCRQGSPSIIVTGTDFCPPNYGLPNEYGGWCNYPREHFEMSEAAFAEIAEKRADIVPVQYRRAKCARTGGIRFTVSGSSHFFEVLISNVGLDGEIIAVKVKGSQTGWIPMGRNWGQNWQCNSHLSGQLLSFEVTVSSSKTLTSYSVAPPHWQFGQTFEGKQF